jgi:hypothetical protein
VKKSAGNKLEKFLIDRLQEKIKSFQIDSQIQDKLEGL